MAYTTLPPDDFAQRLSIIRRHLDGISRALDMLERDIHRQQQTDGERAAQAAREVVYQQRPGEVKIVT